MKTKSLELNKEEYQNKLLNFHLNPIMDRIRKEALENKVPIILDETGAFLSSLCKIIKPKRILEIGCAVGYSSALFALNSNAYIDTIEIDKEMVDIAKKNHLELGLDSKINIIYGDALNMYDLVKDNKYDLIFIDAAKGQYIKFFELYSPLLSDNGLIITDNLYFHDNLFIETESKNLYGLIKKINDYNNYLLELKDFETHIFKIGDGISLTTRK